MSEAARAASAQSPRDASSQVSSIANAVEDQERRILLLAPLQNDAPLTAEFLAKAGLHSEICGTERELCEKLRAGCGAVLVAEEALDPDAGAYLIQALSEQPSWSDVPVALITSGTAEGAESRSARVAELRRSGKVTLIERPFRPATLVSTLEVALRSRGRQHQVRELIEERTRISAHAEQQARIFGTILSTITDFAYILDRESRFIFANQALLDLWGLQLSDAVGKSFADLGYPPELAIKLERQAQQVLETGKGLRDETAYTSPRGLSGHYEYIFSPVFGVDNSVEVVVGSTRDVTERKQAEEALHKQAEALRDADRRKDEFLAMLAHELRNPLASVLSAVAVLKSSDDDENHGWATQVLERQTGQLARLIDDLLDVSRITSGKIRLRKERLDAADVLARACETARPLCSERDHEVRCDYPHGQLWVDADPTRLEQMLLNLLTNAAKYTPRGGVIEVTGKREGDSLVFSVRDNGMGIAPEWLPAMFELFAQGERSIARSEGGLGIGLTIVKRLTEMHGGRIGAESGGRDQGSKFSIVLPAAEPPLKVAPSEAEKGGATSGKLRIMVVDDNRDTAEGLARLLKRDGHEVIVAYDGHAAVAKAHEACPQVVLLDIGLPGIDGYEVAGRLREEETCSRALVIALSGYGQDEDRRRSRAAGFDFHLVKPVSFDELRALISSAHRPTFPAPHSAAL